MKSVIRKSLVEVLFLSVILACFSACSNYAEEFKDDYGNTPFDALSGSGDIALSSAFENLPEEPGSNKNSGDDIEKENKDSDNQTSASSTDISDDNKESDDDNKDDEKSSSSSEECPKNGDGWVVWYDADNDSESLMKKDSSAYNGILFQFKDKDKTSRLTKMERLCIDYKASNSFEMGVGVYDNESSYYFFTAEFESNRTHKSVDFNYKTAKSKFSGGKKESDRDSFAKSANAAKAFKNAEIRRISVYINSSSSLAKCSGGDLLYDADTKNSKLSIFNEGNLAPSDAAYFLFTDESGNISNVGFNASSMEKVCIEYDAHDMKSDFWFGIGRTNEETSNWWAYRQDGIDKDEGIAEIDVKNLACSAKDDKVENCRLDNINGFSVAKGVKISKIMYYGSQSLKQSSAIDVEYVKSCEDYSSLYKGGDPEAFYGEMKWDEIDDVQSFAFGPVAYKISKWKGFCITYSAKENFSVNLAQSIPEKGVVSYVDLVKSDEISVKIDLSDFGTYSSSSDYHSLMFSGNVKIKNIAILGDDASRKLSLSLMKERVHYFPDTVGMLLFDAIDKSKKLKNDGEWGIQEAETSFTDSLMKVHLKPYYLDNASYVSFFVDPDVVEKKARDITDWGGLCLAYASVTDINVVSGNVTVATIEKSITPSFKCFEWRKGMSVISALENVSELRFLVNEKGIGTTFYIERLYTMNDDGIVLYDEDDDYLIDGAEWKIGTFKQNMSFTMYEKVLDLESLDLKYKDYTTIVADANRGYDYALLYDDVVLYGNRESGEYLLNYTYIWEDRETVKKASVNKSSDLKFKNISFICGDDDIDCKDTDIEKLFLVPYPWYAKPAK